jgi:hypothetical protein
MSSDTTTSSDHDGVALTTSPDPPLSVTDRETGVFHDILSIFVTTR